MNSEQKGNSLAQFTIHIRVKNTNRIMKEKLLIVGTSHTARSIYSYVKDYDLYNLLGFVVDKEYKTIDRYCDKPVFTFDNLPSEFDKEKDFLFIAIEWDRLNAVRKKVYLRLKNEGYRLANIISPHAMIHGNILGDNCWITDGVIIENDVTIYEDVMIKSRATIQHLSTIEPHCFVGANSLLAGHVHLGEQTYVGISATIFDAVNIGKKCLIGACTYVKRHIPDCSVIKTKNDEFVMKQYGEDEIENKLLTSISIR